MNTSRKAPAMTPRAQQILALALKDPSRWAASIAREVGASKEYVRQVLVKAGLPTAHWNPRRCIRCGKRMGFKPKTASTGQRHLRRLDTCYACRAILRVTEDMYPCETCGKMVHRFPKQADAVDFIACSPTCRAIATHQRNPAFGIAGSANLRAYREQLRTRPACKHGHPWTEENTYRYPSGGRACRTCQRERYNARKVSQ